jgi:hypothetical protein
MGDLCELRRIRQRRDFPATISTDWRPVSDRIEGIYPVWSPDGTELVYPLPTGQFAVVSVTSKRTFAVGNPVQFTRGGLITLGPQTPRTYDMMPDGRIVGIVVGPALSGGATATEIQVVVNWFEELKTRVPTK